MKVAVRKLQVEDAAKLQMLVAENIDAIEPGLVVLDSRLLLGHATIDVVGLDANGALVLIATGLSANEEMLLKAVEAYSWCREYPQSLERLYPSCIISDERPPRLIFVVERMPDAFHRKIKQLGFPEVDCVEFRHLEVDGVPAVFFESILRLRRPVVTPAPAPRAETPESPATSENVIAMNGPVAARATSLKLQKLLNQAVSEGSLNAPRQTERPAPVREPASVVSMVSRQAAAIAPRVERPRPAPALAPQPEPVIAEPIAAPVIAVAPALVPQPEPLVVPAPVIVTPEPVIATPVPIVPAPAPVIVTPEPIVLPTAAAEPDADLVAQMERALASIDQRGTAEPVLEAEPTLVIAAETEPAVAAEPALELVTATEPIAAAEPTLELVSASERVEIAAMPEPEVAAEPKLELESASAPKLEIPALNGTAQTVPSLNGDRVSLRSLPELSLRPSAPVAMPRPAPIPVPAPVVKTPPAVETPAAEATEPRVSFKDLAAALLGSTPAAVSQPVEAVPAAPTPLAVETAEPVVVEPVSLEMAQAVADLEPALTVEALINSTLTSEPAAPVAAEVPAAKPEAPAAKTPEPEAAKKAEPALPLEFAGLQFPKDGVMTRQWMEFLSQMSNSK